MISCNPNGHFPDGVIIQIFDTAADAMIAGGKTIWKDGRHNFGKGRVGWVSLECDPDVLIGVEPCAFLDRTTNPWPPAMEKMIRWRAERANALMEHCVGSTKHRETSTPADTRK